MLGHAREKSAAAISVMTDKMTECSKVAGPEPLYTARIQYYTTPERDAAFRKLAVKESMRVSELRRNAEVTFLTSQGVELPAGS